MKLNKPKPSKANSNLQNYVSGLLFDDSNSMLDNNIPSNVTPIKRNTVETTHETRNVIEVLSECEPSQSSQTLNEMEHELSVGVKEEPQIDSRKPPTELSSNSRSEEIATSDLNQSSHQNTTKQFETELNDPRLKNVEKLLAKISLANVLNKPPIPQPGAQNGSQSKNAHPQVETSSERQNEKALPQDELIGVDPEIVEEESQLIESTRTSFELRENGALRDSLGSVFQTLVFEVSKLPLAVPLIKLGGIVNVSEVEITPLVGTPHWFMGLVPNERGNLMVVDTQQFLMPEKKKENKEYKYLIILDDSQWALACHSVGDAKNLSPEDVRWSARSSKRPWFAGMVVEYMSALVEVDELINMLASNLSEE